MEPRQKNGQGPPATSLKFLNPKDIASNHDEMSQVSSASVGSTGTDKQIKISVSMKLIDPKTKIGDMNNEQFLAPQDKSNESLKDFSSISQNQNSLSQQQTNTKTSYYVRDKFKPKTMHQTNIEKMFLQFKEHQ
jgi:hypothetical protein